MVITSTGDGRIPRLYSIVLPAPDGGSDVEFALFCDFAGPQADFMQHAGALDRLAASIRWRER
jgi:hypothetical protein